MSNFLDTPIEYLKGIGPQRGDMLKKELQIFTYYDLLSLYPFRYVDRSKFYKIKDITEELPYVQLKGKIIRTELLGEKFTKRFVAYLKDDTGVIELVWFQGAKWLEGKFKPDIEYVVLGKPSEFRGKYNITHPDVDLASDESIKLNAVLQPVYPSTEKLKSKGLDSKGILKLQEVLVPQLQHKIEETLPDSIINQYKLMNKEQACKQIHFPENPELLKRAELRLKFEELFYIQLKLLKSKHFRKNSVQSFVFEKLGHYFNTFFNEHLPFELTNAQKRVIKEIRNDVRSGKQMNRLLQGDVGSGKTIVSLMCMLMALDNGFQACIMAPTEILAQQHFVTISELVKPLGITCSLLTGSVKTKARREILQNLTDGTLQLIIGTHALLEDPVKFKNIGFVVIDEQHRFGVAQRAKLHNKNVNPPHVLVMSATPIPRTLAMTLYGDLDTSVIDELPPGRKPIQTIHYTDAKRLRVYGFMKEQIALGRQIYVVYPLIEESEKLDLKNLMEGYDSLSEQFPLPEYRISILHGRMESAKKDFEMQAFVKGQTQIMVATTVIEVGVNVPNASVMVIENAERFGLSQLHQLRGRVGRGADQSYCMLLTSFKLSQDAKVRMATMCRTNDGFEVAEVDLQLRGPGDIEGTQQSGILNLKIADLAKDQQILQWARQVATEILDVDPQLLKAENQILNRQLIRQNKTNINWGKVA
ncbi:MAG TPA: ATP-dependent DNA helicase RecG [Bacteroidia bacterium]|nr:ATP-dependent DNA helicase RecG [Bacteroidia bacterium]